PRSGSAPGAPPARATFRFSRRVLETGRAHLTTPRLQVRAVAATAGLRGPPVAVGTELERQTAGRTARGPALSGLPSGAQVRDRPRRADHGVLRLRLRRVLADAGWSGEPARPQERVVRIETLRAPGERQGPSLTGEGS